MFSQNVRTCLHKHMRTHFLLRQVQILNTNKIQEKYQSRKTMALNYQISIADPAERLEKIFIYKDVIFWSFDRKNYAKANWWKKIASAGIGEFFTIRTANTVRKISQLCG